MFIRYGYEITLACQQPTALVCLLSVHEDRAARQHVQLRDEARHGGVDVAVEDTGVGIPGDRLHEIFEPFVQVDRTLTSTHEGAGLGLAISRDLARAMDGELAAESTPGVGSVFTLTLPRGRGPVGGRE